MAILVATFIQYAVAVYAAIGLGFALFVVSHRLARLEPAAAQSGIIVRMMFIPGLLLLWPILLRRVFGKPRGSRP